MTVMLLAAIIAFGPGETLDYDVRLGPMTVGSLQLSELAPDTVMGESCRHFHGVMTVSVRFLFRGRYDLDAWATAEELVTLRSAKLSEETRYHGEWTADYRYPDSMVVYSDGDSFELAGEARDLLTTWYYLRTLPLTTGDTVGIRVHSDRRNQDARVIARGCKTMTTPAGRFRCQELGQHGTGLLGTMFLTDDEQRLPAVIRTTIGGVPVTAVLRSAKPGQEEK